MRFLTFSGIIALFVVLGVPSFAKAEEFLLVEEPLAKVYKELDPMSPLIKQVKKGEYLELVYEGESWHKVRVDGKIGWIERRAGKIVEKKGGISVISLVLLILLVGGTLGAVIFFIAKNRTPSMAEVDEF
jgi:hypothetical protein